MRFGKQNCLLTLGINFRYVRAMLCQQVPLALWFVCEYVIMLLMIYLHLKLLGLLSALKSTSDFEF